jgi:sulfur carrier protein
MPEETTQLTINGEASSVPDGCSVDALIKRLGLAGKRCAVELNQNIISSEDWERTRLAAGDQVEIVNFVGGG